MKKFFTVLAAAALITVFVSSAFAAFPLVSTNTWNVRGLELNATNIAAGSNSTAVIGNLTISASTYMSTSTNSSLGNFTAGALDVYYGPTPHTSFSQANNYDGIIGNSSKFYTTDIDYIVSNFNGTAGATGEYYGFDGGSNNLVFLVSASGGNLISSDDAQSVLALAQKGSLTPASMVSNIGTNPWYFFTLVQNGTDAVAGAVSNPASYFYGTFTKTGTTGATANQTSYKFYLDDGLQQYNGTDGILNATAIATPEFGITAGNASTGAAAWATAPGLNYLTMDSSSQVLVGSEKITGAAASTFGLRNATLFTVALKNPTVFDSLSGTWKMLAVFPNGNRNYLGKFTLDANNSPSSGAIVSTSIAGGAVAVDADTAAQFLTNWNVSVTSPVKPFATGDIELTRVILNDVSAARSITAYTRQMRTTSHNLVVGGAVDESGNKGLLIMIGTPASSSSDDDDDFLGCVFNPAASFGLEWLLLLLAPALAVLRSRFRK